MPRIKTEQRVETILRGIPKERASLLPALWTVADEVGWIDEERTAAIAQVMNLPVAEVYGVASFYALLPTRPEVPARVCDDLICHLKGSQALLAELRQAGVEASEWPCLGRCDKAPAALVGAVPVVDATAAKIQAVLGRG